MAFAITSLRPWSWEEDIELDQMAAILRAAHIASLEAEEERLMAEKKEADDAE